MDTQSSARRPAASSWMAAAAVLALAVAAPAAAQPDRELFVLVDGGWRMSTSGFSQQVVFPESGGVYEEILSRAAAHEEARFDSAYRVGRDLAFDVGGGVRLTPDWGFGIGVSRFGIAEPAAISGQAPHPLHFDRDRSLTGRSLPLARTETAIHLQGRFRVPHLAWAPALARVPGLAAVTITAFGGPTVFRLRQQLVDDVRFAQEYPYDTARFTTADHRQTSGAGLGFHFGADIAYQFSPLVGVGGMIRYSRATVGIAAGTDRAIDVRAGGLHAAGGLRLRLRLPRWPF